MIAQCEEISSEALEKSILEFVASEQHVSFCSLKSFLRVHGFSVDGSSAIFPGRNENLILWVGLSDELFLALKRLLESGRLFLHPVPALIYYIDGEAPRLPLARHDKHTTEHWVPCVLCTFPMKAGTA